MITSSRFTQSLRDIAAYFPEDEVWRFPSWSGIVRNMYDLRNNWPQYVHEPRVLFTVGRYPIYHQAIGHGPIHDVVDITHGGELLRGIGFADHGAFLCEHPWMLEDRTVHFLYNTPYTTATDPILGTWVNSGSLSPWLLVIPGVDRHEAAGIYHDASQSMAALRQARSRFGIYTNNQTRTWPVNLTV